MFGDGGRGVAPALEDANEVGSVEIDFFDSRVVENFDGECNGGAILGERLSIFSGEEKGDVHRTKEFVQCLHGTVF